MTFGYKYDIIVSSETVVKELRMKKQKNMQDILKAIPLFSQLNDSSLATLCDGAEIAEFVSGETVVAPSGKACVTVIIKGSASVMKPIGEKELLMRVISSGSVTGVAALFDEERTPLSVLKANSALSALFMPRQRIIKLIKSDGEFAESYARFLTSRIRYLNSRIKAYTSGSAEAKLAFQLLLSDENRAGKAALGVSLTKLAELLDIGRASLYRALDILSEKKVIEKRGREILITDRQTLENIANGM